jgi:hypothetical protein
MPYRLPLFEFRVQTRRRGCRWYLFTGEGRVVMQGSEATRAAASYQAARALFLMLLGSAQGPATLLSRGLSRSPDLTKKGEGKGRTRRSPV